MGRYATLLIVVGCGPPLAIHDDPDRRCPTGAVSLASQDDVARLAACPVASSIAMRTGAALDLGPLARLEVIDGDLRVGPSVGLERLALPRLRSIAGTFRVVGNGNLRAVALPALVRAGRIEIEGNVALTSVALPKLAAVDSLAIIGEPELEMIDLSALATVGELVIADNPKLVILEGPIAGVSARIEHNAMLAR